MENNHWERAKEIFSQALDQSPQMREALVRAACGADDALFHDVVRLLDAQRRSSRTLSRPLMSLVLSGPTEEPPRFQAPTVVARRFQILGLIARGGMGDVYAAEDLQLGVRVALKTIRPEIAADQRVLELFKNEIQMARRVTHPNVCRIYDLAEHDEPTADGGNRITFFLTMELLAGETLSEHLKRHGPFSSEDALSIIGQLASALQAAHDAGVIHRDFKPGNVMLLPTEEGLRAVVTDFGLAVVREQAGLRPIPDAAGGTPAYMAPEQRNGGEATTATDVFSMGLVLAEIVGARVPKRSDGQTSLETDQENTNAVVLPPTAECWEPILRRCLEADPARRYSRPGTVADELMAAVQPPPTRSWRRPQFVGVTGAVAVALLGLTTVVGQRYGLWNRSSPITFRKLGSQPANDILWRPSPDGRYFAVMDGASGNLGLRDISTGETRLLTHSAKTSAENQVTSAAFSPDGNRIAYSWVEFENAGCEMRLVDTVTGESILLRRDAALVSCEVAAWSPDGARILSRFTSPDFLNQIAVVAVNDSAVALPLPKGSYRDLVFSPDGQSIFFGAPQKPYAIESDIFEVPTYGGVVMPVVQDSADDVIIGFSSDGRRLVFSSDRKGTYGLWSLAFSGNRITGEPVELAHDLGRASPLGLIREGAFYYKVVTDSVDVYTADIDVAGGQVRSAPTNVVKRFRGSFRFPSWSADGNQLSFISFLDGAPRIWIHSRQTGEVRTVAPDLASFLQPKWDPSGGGIFVTGADHQGRQGIYRVDPNTGDSALAISSKVLNGVDGVWARDGHTLFGRFSDPTAGLFRIDSRTGGRQVLYVPPSGSDLGLENLALSPDEQVLVFQARQRAAGTSSLMSIPASGGIARTLLTIAKPEQFLFGSFAWTADSTEILTARTRGDKSELWLVPRNGGAARKIGFPEMRIAQLKMSPGGRTIAFTSGEAAGEVWMAENLLP
ncbi:MAG: protein kinase [Acidobacteriota bacterium]